MMLRVAVVGLIAALVGSAVCEAARAAAVPEPARTGNAPVETARALDANVALTLDGIVRDGAAPNGTAPGVSVAIVEGGKIVYARAAGLEDVGAQRKATIATRFRIGSITKMFTAVTVMQLVERGVIHLDDHLSAYLPNVAHASEVTIRQLLMHTSGIPNYADDAFLSGTVGTPTTPAAIIASMAGPLQFTPGSNYAYSNTGYVLLGQVIEHVTGEPLAQYERTHIFLPAGMHDTTEGMLSIGPGTAVGYMDAKAAPVGPIDASWLYACGDIVSTASDVARFDIALMNGTLISWSSFAQMRASPIAMSGGMAYGLGLTMSSLGNLDFVGHHGGLPGFESENVLQPEQKFAVVALGNAFSFDTRTEERPIQAALFPATSAHELARLTTTGAGEDPAVTARLRTFFTALQNGQVDRTTLSPEMNAAMTPQQVALVASQLTAAGSLQSFVFVRKDLTAGPIVYTVYTYTAILSGQPVPLRFVLDPSGKIAGFH